MATILIVDDLPANRKFLVTLLAYHGHRVLEASDGREGLAVVQSDRPALVITDVLMPVMDGYEFVKELRRDPVTRDIPVVFFTAHYGEREARTLALSSGVSYVLTKPAESEAVLDVISRVLAGELAAASPADAAVPAFDRQHLRLLTDKLSEKTEDLRTANARLRALINISLEFTSERDADRRLEHVCSSARDLFGATSVTLGLISRDHRILDRFVMCSADAVTWITAGEPLAGLLGKVVAERQAIRGENPGGDPATLQLPTRHPRVQAFLAAPIVSPSHIFGWICLATTDGKAFTEDDEQLVVALVGQVGRIYELEEQIRDRNRADVELRSERHVQIGLKVGEVLNRC